MGHFEESLVAARIEANVMLCFRRLACEAKIGKKNYFVEFFPLSVLS